MLGFTFSVLICLCISINSELESGAITRPTSSGIVSGMRNGWRYYINNNSYKFFKDFEKEDCRR